MLALELPERREDPLDILCLGAHCDDIEIGCGGTVLRLVEQYPDARFHWVVLASNDVRAAEAQAAAEHFLHGAGKADIRIERFRESYFPWVGADIKDYFESAEGGRRPRPHPHASPPRPAPGPPPGGRPHLEHVA